MRRSEQRRAAVLRCISTTSPAVRSPTRWLRDDSLFVRALAHAAADRAPELDAVIDRHSHGWSVGRIQPLERSILRVALIEMLHPDAVPGEQPIPPEGAIEEAVESAKTFCGRRRLASSTACSAAVLRDVRENARIPMTQHGPPRRPDRAPGARRRAAALGRALPRRRGDDGRGLRGARDAGSRRARAAEPRRGLRAGAGPGHPAVGPRGLLVSASASYPEHPSRGGRALPAGDALLRRGADGRARGGDALLAARRRQAHPAGARARDRACYRPRAERGAAARRGDRADPHLLADPRRPAGDGRRRPAPRDARPVTSSSARTSRSWRATASTPRRSGTCSRTSARRPSVSCRPPQSWPRRPASTAWWAASTPTSAPARRPGPAALAPAARAEDRTPDRRVDAVRTAVGRGRG